MNAIKIVFGILLGVAGIVLIIISFSNFYKYIIQKKKCTSSVLGEVIRYTSNTPPLPKVLYMINGKKYKVTGPRFRAIITEESVTPFNSFAGSVNSYVDEKMRLHVCINRNIFGSVVKTPLELFYPIGMKVNVFFDPNNPKNAFVERYCDLKWIFWMTLLIGVICIIGGALVVVLL